MLNTIIKKRAQVLTLILVLLVFLTAMTASAVTKRIDEDGGTINIASGVSLKFPQDALDDDYDGDDGGIVISADMYQTADFIEFLFGPSPMSFQKSLRLKITWEAIEEMDLDTFTLYSPDGEEIQPVERSWGLLWKIKHFSLYYYRRR